MTEYDAAMAAITSEQAQGYLDRWKLVREMVSFLGRPRFTQDIDALAILAECEWESAIRVDLGPVRQWVSDFAAATSMSDLLEDFDEIVARRRQR